MINSLKILPAIFALMMFLLPMTVGAQYPPPLVRNQYDTNAAPNLTGDITTTGGGLATTLKNTGTAGQYTKVTFDAQGRETSGTTLSSGDIPDLSGVYDRRGNKFDGDSEQPCARHGLLLCRDGLRWRLRERTEQ